MSSGAYMAGRPPNEDKRCPHCGAPLKPGRACCWLCLEEHSIREGEPEPHHDDERASVSRSRQASKEGPAWLVLSVLVFLLCAGVVTTCGAVGLLILPPIVATPIIVRLLVSRLRRAREHELEGTPVVESGLSAIGVTIAVGLASFIAYFAICTAWFNAQNWR